MNLENIIFILDLEVFHLEKEYFDILDHCTTFFYILLAFSYRSCLSSPLKSLYFIFDLVIGGDNSKTKESSKEAPMQYNLMRNV